MTSEEVAAIVESELRTSSAASEMRAAVVKPYLHQFLLVDSYKQLTSPAKSIVLYWVVAETQMYSVFFDPRTKEFGLADPLGYGLIPKTVGVRGDFADTFCAM